MSNAPPARPPRQKPSEPPPAAAPAPSRWKFSFFSSGRKSVEREEVVEEDAFDAEQAREAAVREVKGALSGPQEVSRLRKIRAEYEAQRGAVEVQIALLTGRQAEEARAGLELVARCRERVEKVKLLQGRLETALAASGGLLPQYPLLRRAHIARRNLHRTAQELESIMEMPLELERIEKMLQGLVARPERQDKGSEGGSGDESDEDGAAKTRDDSDRVLPDVHKRLILLDRRQRAALESARADSSKRQVVEAQLASLNDFFRRVESRCLHIVRNCIYEAQNRPAMLVKALQMVQRQEAADIRARKEAQGRKGGQEQEVPVRAWYAKSVSQLEEYLRGNFEMLVGTLIEGPDSVDVALVLQEQRKILDDLVIAKDMVEPCFPPQYKIFERFVRTYHSLIVHNVEGLTEKFAATLSTRDIIDLVCWLREYHAVLNDIEAPEDCVQPVLTAPDKLTRLLQGYNLQTEGMMRNWAARILEDDLQVAPESSMDGTLYTIAPIDLFKMIDQQFEVVDALEMERSMHTLAMSVTEVLGDYCLSVHDVVTRLWNDLNIDHIAAQVNNAARCVDCCSSLMDELQKKLRPELLDDVELALVGDNFAKVGKDGCESLAKVIVSDLIPLLKRLFTAKWYSGEDKLMESIAATILDYADEINEYLIGTYYRRVMVEVLERLAVALVAQLLEGKKHEGAVITIDADFLAGLDLDYDILFQCFLDASVPERMLAPRLAPLRALMHLLSIEIEEGKEAVREVSEWMQASLLQFPDLEVDVVARLLRRRDLDSKVRHSVLSACSDIAKRDRKSVV